jgi:hypothetical protein
VVPDIPQRVVHLLAVGGSPIFIRGKHMNDNTPRFNAKSAFTAALATEAGISIELATKITEYLTDEGFIDYPVVAETLEGVRE